jgi:(heptosyl)LPS beta-1,4-glucosyltransferase
MVGISAVIITFNEERNIARCIASLRRVADEVVVVDSGSSDGTQAIAETAGAHVVHHPWAGYSGQKNFANTLARCTYILSMDADEALSPELEASLLRVKAKGPQGAYRFNRITNYCGTWVRHGGWYPDVKVRLFPKGRARWEGEHVHEELVLDADLPVTHLHGDLLHWSYHTLDDHRARIERYSDLHARKMLEAGNTGGAVKRWLSPVAKFVQGYVLQLGFLDGSAGFHIARLSARAVHLKYTKLQRLRHG